MALHLWIYIAFIKAVILVAGALIVYYAARAARRNSDAGLWYLTAGMVLIGAGILLSGVPVLLYKIPEIESVAFTSTFSVVGLIVIVYGLFSTEDAVSPG